MPAQAWQVRADDLALPRSPGGVAEWLNAAVSKTVSGVTPLTGVRIPPPPLVGPQDGALVPKLGVLGAFSASRGPWSGRCGCAFGQDRGSGAAWWPRSSGASRGELDRKMIAARGPRPRPRFHARPIRAMCVGCPDRLACRVALKGWWFAIRWAVPRAAAGPASVDRGFRRRSGPPGIAGRSVERFGPRRRLGRGALRLTQRCGPGRCWHRRGLRWGRRLSYG